MKQQAKKILQTMLGFEQYLFTFAKFKIKTFKWDKNEQDFFHFLRLLEPNTNVLDVGSNIGITTVLLSKQVGTGTVYSFEPLPPNYRTLDKIVSYYRCPNVKVFKYAVGDEEKAEVEMVLPEVEDVKMQGLSHIVHEDLPDFNVGKRFKTQLRMLDNVEEMKGKKIGGIKLDVENFEYFALKGAKEIILRDKPIIYAELWENENRTRCFDLMKEYGYEVKISLNDELKDFDPSKHKTQNFFFIA